MNDEEEEARRTSVRTKRLTKEGVIALPCVDSKKTPASIPSPSNCERSVSVETKEIKCKVIYPVITRFGLRSAG